MTTQMRERLLSAVNQLPDEKIEEVVEFALRLAGKRAPTLPASVLGEELSRFAGRIPAEDLADIAAAIEEDCE
jgi:hypothetical protein